MLEIDLRSPTVKIKIWGSIFEPKNLNEGDILENFKKAGWLSGLWGEFAIVLKEARGLHLIRDAVGIMPLYYREFSNRIFVCNTLDSLLALEKPSEDRSALARLWVEDFTDLEATPFAEIKKVPPGHMMSFDVDGKITKLRFWYLPQTPSPGSVSLEDFNHSFQNALRVRGLSAQKSAVFLSGGLDSSMLALGMQSQGVSMATFNGQLPSPTKLQDDQALDCVLERLSRETHRTFDFNQSPESLWYDERLKSIFYTPSLQIFGKLLEMAKNDGCDVAFTGLGGDDLYNHENVGAEYLRCGQVKNLLHDFNNREGLSLAEYFKSLFKPFLPYWLARGLRAFYGTEMQRRQLQRKKMGSSFWQQSLAWRVHGQGELVYSIENEQNLAHCFGLRMSYPLLDQKLVEIAYHSPISLIVDGPFDKAILRKASAGLVPELVRTQRSLQSYFEVSRDALLQQRCSLENHRLSASRHWQIKDNMDIIHLMKIFNIRRFSEMTHE